MQPMPRSHAPGSGLEPSRRNDFDSLRLAAATSVIFSHAFLLSAGEQRTEPLMVLTHGQCVFGVVGVFVFFIVSGYLVTQSFEETGSLARFLLKRFLRIYPGYAACILFLAFGLGAATTTLPLAAYWRDPGTWGFVAANLAMNVERNGLPAVRFTGWDIGTIVDGPLWSLPCEVLMYLMVAALGSLRLLRLAVLVPLLVAGLACVWFDTAQLPGVLPSAGWLLPFFVAGMIGYRVRDRGLARPLPAVLAALGLVAAAAFGGFILVFPVLGTVVILFLAFRRAGGPLPATRFGDLSYGLYIYGWPVEQALLRYFGIMPWWSLFLVAMPLSTLVAFLSWRLVERPALRLKPAAIRLPLS
jgi:peptidoglycan/LPS O-acetylase OafA/YrhL